MKKTILFLLALLMTTMAGAQKREMRGAWIQCVNGQFQGKRRCQRDYLPGSS